MDQKTTNCVGSRGCSVHFRFLWDISNVNFRQSSLSASSMSSGSEANASSSYELQQDRKGATREQESVGLCHGHLVNYLS
jgi:hypothetical protein